jgi:hypothetical protein
METRTASDIYEQLKKLRYQLDQLATQGKIVMSTDDLALVKKDSVHAITAALEGLEQAIDATCWMETLTTLDGEYPPLLD